MPSDPDDTIAGKIEHDLAGQSENERKGNISTLTCPECGGTLWQLDQPGQLRFQCHVGHGSSGDHLLEQKMETVERSGWYTMRGLKELMLLSNELATQASQEGNVSAAAEFSKHSNQAQRLLQKLEELLLQR